MPRFVACWFCSLVLRYVQEQTCTRACESCEAQSWDRDERFFVPCSEDFLSQVSLATISGNRLQGLSATLLPMALANPRVQTLYGLSHTHTLVHHNIAIASKFGSQVEVASALIKQHNAIATWTPLPHTRQQKNYFREVVIRCRSFRPPHTHNAIQVGWPRGALNPVKGQCCVCEVEWVVTPTWHIFCESISAPRNFPRGFAQDCHGMSGVRVTSD